MAECEWCHSEAGPTHIEPWSCLEAYRRRLDKALAEVERLKAEIVASWSEREGLLNKAADRHTELAIENERLRAENLALTHNFRAMVDALGK